MIEQLLQLVSGVFLDTNNLRASIYLVLALVHATTAYYNFKDQNGTYLALCAGIMSSLYIALAVLDVSAR